VGLLLKAEKREMYCYMVATYLKRRELRMLFLSSDQLPLLRDSESQQANISDKGHA